MPSLRIVKPLALCKYSRSGYSSTNGRWPYKMGPRRLEFTRTISFFGCTQGLSTARDSVAPAPETPKPSHFFQPLTILGKTKLFLLFLRGLLRMTIFSVLRSTHPRIFQNFARRIMDTKETSMNLFSVCPGQCLIANPRTRSLGPSLSPTSHHRKRVRGSSDRPLHVRRSSQSIPGKNSGSFRFQCCTAGQS
jgi:hypothetical protein